MCYFSARAWGPWWARLQVICGQKHSVPGWTHRGCREASGGSHQTGLSGREHQVAEGKSDTGCSVTLTDIQLLGRR